VSVEFIGTCVGLRFRDLQAYDDSEREITYRTFRKHVGADVIREINENIGYPGPGVLTLASDYHVRYGKGKWKGKPAVCMHHSAIHHIWTL
jgi:hypothetical protein